jgi:dTDP-4-amino-4,6-dideoxygalactose transaminase
MGAVKADVRSTFLPFALPDTDQTEIDEVAAAIASGWITTGPRTRRFEADFAAYLGVKHAVALNSCTAAMHLALEAIGLRRGDEVVTSPFTFAATAEVVRYFDAKPVLVDVERESLNLDPEKVEAVLTPRTRALLPVHFGGLPAELEPLRQIARHHGLRLVEDAAHALPARHGGQLVGSGGDITCFSFYATKTLTTAEGGMICTDDDTVAERCRVMSLHGISHDAWKRYTAEGSWYYEIVAPGFKYNMTDVAAAMGLAQLAKLDRMRERRAAIAARYHAAFTKRAELEAPADAPAGGQHAWHLYALRLNLERLKRRNIGTSVHFIPLHVHPYYRETYGYRPEDYPVAWREFQREISLPIYSKMSDQDVSDVVTAVCEVAEEHRR